MVTPNLVLIVVILLIFLGVLGTIVPLLPGVPLVFISICAYGWYENFNVITPKLIAVFAALTVLSIFINYISATLGAKKFGSSKYGTGGALIGTLIGIFVFPPLGIFIGPWVGAFIGEYIYRKDINKSFQAGVGAVVGLLSGIVFDLAIALIMAIWFLVKVF